MQRVNILGTIYTVEELTEEQDEFLKDCGGYCDKTSHRIVVRANSMPDDDLDDYDVYKNKCIRHEIIHAYLFESGLHENFKHQAWGHDETMIDWFAVQFPKIRNTFLELNCL